jgi:hypothetical protein
MRGRWTWIGIALFGSAALAAGGAVAGEQATAGWTQITQGHSGPKANLGLARAKDGTLHVLWAGPGRPPWKSILDTPISAAGVVGSPKTIVPNWDTVHPPGAVTAPDGTIHVIVSGQKSATNPTDPYRGLNELVGPGDWKLGAKAFGSASITEASNADVRTALLKSGQVIDVWLSAATSAYKVGTDPSTAPQILKPTGTGPTIAADLANGEAVVAYQRLDTGLNEFRRVYPTLGAPQVFPGNAKLNAPQLAGRVGGGIYTAYTPDGARVWLVRYGGRQASVPAPKGTQILTAGLAPGPEGRLWVFYGNSEKTYVTRTNKTVSGFEPVQTFPSPPKLATYFRLEGEGSAGPLDLFVDVTIDGAAKDGSYTRHVLAVDGLAVAKAPVRSRGKVTAVRVTVRVVDAGDGVPGAVVSGLPVGTKTTDAKGSIVFTVPATKHGTFRLAATKAGYLTARGSLSL